MSKAPITVFEHIEDFDNAELPMDDRIERMKEAVEFYNQEYGTKYSPSHTVYEYVKMKYYGGV